MYRIYNITDKNGMKKTDKDALLRIGRIIDDCQSEMSVGSNGFLYCTFPDYSKSILTTKIVRIQNGENRIMIETLNSKYWLKRVAEE